MRLAQPVGGLLVRLSDATHSGHRPRGNRPRRSPVDRISYIRGVRCQTLGTPRDRGASLSPEARICAGRRRPLPVRGPPVADTALGELTGGIARHDPRVGHGPQPRHRAVETAHGRRSLDARGVRDQSRRRRWRRAPAASCGWCSASCRCPIVSAETSIRSFRRGVGVAIPRDRAPVVFFWVVAGHLPLWPLFVAAFVWFRAAVAAIAEPAGTAGPSASKPRTPRRTSRP